MFFDSLVDYQVLCAGNFTLNAYAGGHEPPNQTLRFVVPDDLHRSSACGRRPVLAFKVWPLVNSRLCVLIEKEEVIRVSFNKSSVHGHREAVDLSPVLERMTREMDISFHLEAGRCDFADVVMWYKVNHACA